MTGNDTDDTYFRRLVDEAALEEYLTSRLGPADQFTVERHGEGHSNETLFLEWGERDLVLRRPPAGAVADTAHDVLREYHVMDALQDTDVTVPMTVLACEDHSVIGADFYLMERLHGHVLHDKEPSTFAGPTHRERIGEELVETLAAIHTVDYEAVGLGEFGRPEGYIERQVDRWDEQYAWAFEVTAKERSETLVADVKAVGKWLNDNCPDNHPHTLVHGDYKLDNVMYSTDIPPRIVAVFDWEMSTLGDPRADLGWMLSYWRDPKDSDSADSGETLTEPEGYPTRRELVDRYERLSGLTFEAEQFYRALAVYKLGALSEMFLRRYIEGNSDDESYPRMRKRVPALIDRTRRIIDGDEPL